jgi:hypothetical protein
MASRSSEIRRSDPLPSFLKLKLTGTSRFKFLSVLRQSERDCFGFVAIETVWRRNRRDHAQVRFFIGVGAGVEGTTPSVYSHDVANHLTHGILENTYKIEATICKENGGSSETYKKDSKQDLKEEYVTKGQQSGFHRAHYIIFI